MRCVQGAVTQRYRTADLSSTLTSIFSEDDIANQGSQPSNPSVIVAVMPHIIVVGTCDTKLEELLYVRQQILNHPDAQVTFIDVGRNFTSHTSITISQSELISKYAPSGSILDISSLSRGEVNKCMAACATKCVKSLLEYSQKPIRGIISLGGSGGTSLAAAVMRDACPLGFPKLIVSTIASGDTSSIVGETDISLMYSIVDVAGLNGLLRNVLSNAAAAIVGAASSYERFLLEQSQELQIEESSGKRKIRLGITMFGVTTPCVDAMRAHLSKISSSTDFPYTFESFVFHATGHGGLAMERLIKTGGLDAVIDLTTTEMCDYIAGGVMSAGSERLDAAVATGIPSIFSLGATDMVNWGPRSTVPEKYHSRTFVEHNPSITLMRTSPEECKEVGDLIAKKLRLHKGAKEGKCQIWMPRGGVSMLSEKGRPFEDQEADEALFTAIRVGLKGSNVKVIEDDRAVNDESFAVDVAEALVAMLG